MTAQAFAAGFLTECSQPPAEIRLRGITCQECSVTLFGVRSRCENCGSVDVTEETFGRCGELYSYTVQRHPPTPPFKMGPTDDEEFEPRPVGYVDIEDGPRILSVLDADPADCEIGMPLELAVVPGWTDDEGNEVYCYTFRPAEER